MTIQEQFDQVMTESVNMALATSVGDKPNVRIITFAYDPAQKGKIFFTTFKGNQKIKEFEQNPMVACMPLPEGPEAEAQVRIFGVVQKSGIHMEELIAIIADKYPGNAETIREGGDMMEIYEVCFDQAFVTIGMDEAQALQC